jgi:hypothetical protein
LAKGSGKKSELDKAISNLPLTPANKKRLKKLEQLHGAGFWSDFGTGFKQGISDGLDVMGKVADVGVKVAPLLAKGSGKKSELDKAKEALKKYVNKERKTMPSKKHLHLLEKEGIISKTEGGNVFKDIGKVAKKATKGATKAVKSTAKFVDDNKDNIRKAVKNPIVKAGIMGATSMVAPELDPLVGLALSGAGKKKREPSEWVKFVLAFAKQHNLKYSDALKKAGPEYRKMKGGYNLVR